MGHHMRNAVLDSNCLIHLSDSSLLASSCRLRNYEISIPGIVFHKALLYFSNIQKNKPLDFGLNLVEITLGKMEHSEMVYKKLYCIVRVLLQVTSWSMDLRN